MMIFQKFIFMLEYLFRNLRVQLAYAAIMHKFIPKHFRIFI